jgi:hypothetical protein
MTDKEAFATAAGFLLAAVAVAVVAVVGVGGSMAFFWNCLAPDLFGMPTATYRNGVGAAGIMVCLKVLWPSLSFDRN